MEQDVLNQKLEVMVGAAEYIEKLQAGIETATTYYRQGELSKAYQLTTAIITGMQWLLDAIGVIKDILKEDIEIDTFKDTCGEIIEAFENTDTVLIADLFEYEIKDQLGNWYQILTNSYNSYVE